MIPPAACFSQGWGRYDSLSICPGNKWRLFLYFIPPPPVRPRWGDPSPRALNRLRCHSVIEKLQRDDERASVASITCAVLPAVSGQVPTASKGAAVSARGRGFLHMIDHNVRFPMLWFSRCRCSVFIVFFFLPQLTNPPHNDQEKQPPIAAHHSSLLINGETLEFREGPDIFEVTAQSNWGST